MRIQRKNKLNYDLEAYWILNPKDIEEKEKNKNKYKEREIWTTKEPFEQNTLIS